MYKEYFGFVKEPFNITPDPELFYCSKVHEEVLEVIEYQLNKRRGYIVLTGEVGTGKTITCRTLITRLKNFYISYILNPFLSSEEILIKICKDFGININDNDRKGQLFSKLEDFLLKAYREGKNAVIIVDEAQNLDYEVFEMLRQISNIELENAKLVQIILVGQEELIDKLNSKELRQLNQRISTILELKPLDLEETANYIKFRIQESLKYKKYIFSDSAIKKIYEYTKGIPREINQIAEIALLVAYSRQNKKVTKSDVIDAAKEYYRKKNIKTEKKSNKFLIAACFLLLFILAGVYAKIFYSNNKSKNFPHIIIKPKIIKIKKNDNKTSLNLSSENKSITIAKVNQNKIKIDNKSDNKIIVNDNNSTLTFVKDNNTKSIDNNTVEKIDNKTTANISAKIEKQDNKTEIKNVKTFYKIYLGPVDYKIMKRYTKILKKYKISYYVVKSTKLKKYFIHIAFLKNYKNVEKLKKRLLKIGIKDVKIKPKIVTY